MDDCVKLSIAVFYCLVYLVCMAKCGTLISSDPNIGVVGKSLTLQWTDTSVKDATEVMIFVGQLTTNTLLLMWKIQFSSPNPSWTVTEISGGVPEAVFNKNTSMTNEGNKVFKLTIKSVPADIERFKFVCKVQEGIWSIPAEKQITVKLASQPVVDFKVRNSNGNNTVGGKLDMVCAATGYPSPTVKIMKQNNSGTVVLRTATQTVQYLIESLQPFDGGKYICIAKNIAGDMEKDILVEIKYKPIVNFTIVKESKDQHVPMGGNVEMYCSATGFPTPKVAIYTEENSKMVEVVSSMKPIYYTMSNIQPKDAKKYICNATNIAGTSRQEKQFTVKYIKSGSTSSLQNLMVKIGDMLHLNCDVIGFPTPVYAWYRDGSKMYATSKKLTAKFDSDASFGRFSCKASNAAGNQTVTFIIKKLYIKKSQGKEDHILKLGEKKTLDCNIEGHPVIKHTWYKGGKKLSESKTLRVHVDKKDKFGNYTCLGKNSAGEEVILFSLQEQGKKDELGINGARRKTGSIHFMMLQALLFIFALNI